MKVKTGNLLKIAKWGSVSEIKTYYVLYCKHVHINPYVKTNVIPRTKWKFLTFLNNALFITIYMSSTLACTIYYFSLKLNNFLSFRFNVYGIIYLECNVRFKI